MGLEIIVLGYALNQLSRGCYMSITAELLQHNNYCSNEYLHVIIQHNHVISVGNSSKQQDIYYANNHACTKDITNNCTCLRILSSVLRPVIL